MKNPNNHAALIFQLPCHPYISTELVIAALIFHHRKKHDSENVCHLLSCSLPKRGGGVMLRQRRKSHQNMPNPHSPVYHSPPCIHNLLLHQPPQPITLLAPTFHPASPARSLALFRPLKVSLSHTLYTLAICPPPPSLAPPPYVYVPWTGPPREMSRVRTPPHPT